MVGVAAIGAGMVGVAAGIHEAIGSGDAIVTIGGEMGRGINLG